MKATYTQIEKALNNTFEFGIDGSEKLYQAIRFYQDEAEKNASIQKSNYHYTKTDWRKVYGEIKKLIAEN